MLHGYSIELVLIDTSILQHPLPPDFRTRHTVKSFIAGSDSDANMAGQSLLAMHAKAAILYEGAARLASRYNPCKSIKRSACDDG